MGSPQKNVSQLLESPYAKHLPQYPSQSEGFVPNDFGGKLWEPSSTPSKQQHQGNYYSNSNQWRRGNNRYYNVNRGACSGGNNRGGGGYRNNNQNNFQTNYNQQHSSRYSNSGNRQQPYHGQKFNKSDNNSRNDYYHPSMLVDPWKELLDRHNAIKNSEINVPPATSEEDQVSSHEDKSSSDQDAITTAITTTKSETSISIST